MSIVAEIDHILPTLPFDVDCPVSIQLLFTGLLGAATGVVLSYIIREIARYLKE